MSELTKLQAQEGVIVSGKDPAIMGDMSAVCREAGREEFSTEPLVSEGFSLKMDRYRSENTKKELGVWIIKP